MTFSRLCVLAALCAAVLLSYPARAQESQTGPRAAKLAVEVVDGSRRAHPLFVSEKPSSDPSAEMSPPPRLAGWKQPEGALPLARVRLRLAYEGDSVRIKVAAVLDDSSQADVPGPKYGAREEPVGSYLAREGETVSVTELKRFGFEPLVLKVVEAVPEPEMPPTPAPARVVNRLKSVEVVSFWDDGAHLERGRLVLRNVSSKNITALEVNVPGGGVSQTAQAPPTHPLIAPGGTYEEEIGLGSGWRETPHGPEPEPQPDALVVGTVVFDDGSYEGDVKTAARIVAGQTGRAVQLARVLLLVESALDAPGQDAPGAFESLKSQVAALRIDVEPSVLDELVSKFPEMPQGDGRRLLAASALEGLRGGREEALHILEEIERARERSAEGFDLRRQLEAARAQLERRVGKRRD